MINQPRRKQTDWNLWIGLTPIVLLIIWKLTEFIALRVPSLDGFTIYPLMVCANNPITLIAGIIITIWGLTTYAWQTKEPEWATRILFWAIILFGCSFVISFVGGLESKQTLTVGTSVYYLTRSIPLNISHPLEFHFTMYQCDIWGVFCHRESHYVCQEHICDFDSDVRLEIDQNVEIIKLMIDGQERHRVDL